MIVITTRIEVCVNTLEKYLHNEQQRNKKNCATYDVVTLFVHCNFFITTVEHMIKYHVQEIKS